MQILKRVLPGLLLITAFGCAKDDPILPGDRIPLLAADRLHVLDDSIDRFDLGKRIDPQKCEFTIDADNRIWQGERRIFAGLPTESKIAVPRRVMCNGKFVYAGLSTGELVKVDSETRRVEWTADIFATHTPTGGSPFLDIIAAPVYNGGSVYAGGLGSAFCRIRDRDGAALWCLPISVMDIPCATEKFMFVRTSDAPDENILLISTDGKAWMADMKAVKKCLAK